MANELKFGNKVIFLNGLPLTLPVASSDPGSASAGDTYYNSGSNTIRYYNGTAWSGISSGGTVTSVALADGDGSSIFDFSGSPITGSGTINISLHPQNANLVLAGPASGGAAEPTYRSLVINDLPSSIPYSKLSLSNSIVNSDINASAAIAYSKLALSNSIVNADINASAAIAYSKLNLAGSIVNADIATGAAIAYAKLNLSASIVNADIAAGAAIAYNKLAALTANRALQSDGSGFVSASSVTNTELGYLSGVTSAIQTQFGNKISKDGSIAFTGDQSFGGFKATNLADPSSGQDAVTLTYLQARLAGLKPKQAVRAATVAAGTLASSFENGDVIDGVTLVTGDRILIKDQAAPAQNGIYTVNASGAPTRATDFDSVSPIDEINGAWVAVQEGTANAGIVFTQYGVVATIGTDAINFEYFNPIAGLVGGDMITFTGSVFSVDLATASGLESTNPGNVAGQLRIKLEASNPSLKFTGSNELAVKLNAAGAITSGASGLIVGVDNSTIEINSNALRVKAGGITNNEVSASAAIAYSKLALSNSIVNADIASAAAIAYSKLAALTANRALQSDGSGFVSASSVTNTELGYLSGVTSAIQTQLNGKANTALSNLASTAVNVDLSPGSDLAINLGTASLRYSNLFAAAVDSGASALTLKSTASNASVIVNANGTGNFDVQATKLRRSQSGASSNFMEDQYFDGLTLNANVSSAAEISSSLSFAVASFDSAVIEYKIKEATSGKVRIGQFIVTSDGTIASSSDQFSESAILGSALGLSLSADLSGGNVRILYNNTNASNAATMRCHIRRFRA